MAIHSIICIVQINLATMKKNIFISLILFLFLSDGYSQTHEINQQKYWVYRNRLKSKFMWVDNFDHNTEGSCIPSSRLQPEYPDGPRIEFGDATIYYANYIQVLATEYTLLKSYNYSVDNTLRDLFFAIEAFIRLDNNADFNFRDGATQPIDGDINGFFVRDDNGYLFWYFQDLDIPYDWDFSSSYQEHMDYDNYNFDSNPDNDVDPSFKYLMEMSLDQCIHLYLGFALVSKLLDGVELNDGQGHIYNFAQRVRDITHIIQYQLSGTDPSILKAWHIINPADGHEVPEDRGGNARWLSYGFGQAGTQICGYNLHARGSDSPTWKKEFTLGWAGNQLIQQDDWKFRALATIGGIEGIDVIGECIQEFWENNVFEYPQLPLIGKILHPAIYSYDNDVMINSMLDYYKKRLDSAPMEGPSVIATYDWSSDNALVWPERRGVGPAGEEYNGLDYLLMFNLYYLFKKERPPVNSVVFPIYVGDYSFGSYKKPIIIEGPINSCNQNLISVADVTIKSSVALTLERGFEVPLGAKFQATPDPYVFNVPASNKSAEAFIMDYLPIPNKPTLIQTE
jgi:hypothetical protein